MAAMEGSAEAPEAAKRLPHHHVAAVTIGNALEFYDFLTYATFALQIGRTFFPSDNPISSLLASLATFWAGFLTRPVGAYFIGRMGDRMGRKPAMFLSFGLMGLAMLGMTLTPSFATIGWAAPVLVILFRLIQGFALGGEVGPSTAYMAEAAPPHQRALYISLQGGSQQLAILVGGVVAYVLAKSMSDTAFEQWGWRIAFLLGAVIVPFGLMLRSSLAETLEPHEIAEGGPPPQVHIMRTALLGATLLMSATITTYVINNLTTYAASVLHMKTSASIGATVSQGLTGMVMALVGGALADRFGRKPLIIWPRVLLILSALPAYWLIGHFRTPEALFLVAGGLAALLGLAFGGTMGAITELIPKHQRSHAVALIYAIPIFIFGGSTQFMVTWLTSLTGSPLTPGFYMMAAMSLGLVAALLMPETAPHKTGEST